MYKKIYRIWSDGELRKELVKRGYERVKNLTIENYSKELQILIEEVLSEL